MFDPKLLANLKRNSRAGILQLVLILLAILVAGIVAVYTSDESDGKGWFLVILPIAIFFLGVIAMRNQETFISILEQKPNEIESITLSTFRDQPMLTLRTKAGKSRSLIPPRNQKDEIMTQLKSGLPKVRFYV